MNDSAHASAIESQSKLLEEKRAIERGEINDKREIFGWIMYDWANSAFYTTVVGALYSPYLTSLAQADVGENGTIFNLGFLGSVTAKSLWTLTIAAAVFLQVFLLPVLGAIADYSHLMKRFMIVFCYIQVTSNSLM